MPKAKKDKKDKGEKHVIRMTADFVEAALKSGAYTEMSAEDLASYCEELARHVLDVWEEEDDSDEDDD
ncbi:MAG: hypothetical protein HKO76_06095 [Acidimicrobiia bacterium]|nr:hypothetical protein [Acidimicrobiia bacterium]